MKKKYKIAVILGGTSSERRISLKSGKAVCKALEEKKYDFIKIDPKKDNVCNVLLKEKPDLVFIAIHGKGGEDGILQGFLETLKISYTGNSVLSSTITMNKIFTQSILKTNKIKIPRFFVLSKKEYFNLSLKSIEKKIKNSFNFPVIIKAPSQGSTLGIYPITDNSKKSYYYQLKIAIEKAFTFENYIMIEQMICPNTEITISIIGNENPIVLPTLQIKSNSSYFNFKTKYTKNLSSHLIPADLNKNIRIKARKIALKAYELFQCKGFARIDFLIKNNKIYLIDINTIPGLTNISLFPDAAKSIGIKFNELIDIIIKLAKGEKNILKKYLKNIDQIES